MTNDEGTDALSGLVEAIAFDASLADDPVRLRAALADLAVDDAGLDTLITSVRLGVPALVMSGRARAAIRLLVDRAGLRPELAGQLTDTWSSALGALQPARSWQAPAEFENLSTTLPTLALAAPGPTSCLVWPDGCVTALTLSYDGLLIRTSGAAGDHTAGRWRLLATPQAPQSRAATLSLLGPTAAMLAWSDSGGVWGRVLHRDPDHDQQLSAPHLLAAPDQGQARYPMTALRVDDGEVDVLWTADRQQLRLTSFRQWGPTQTALISTPCTGLERLAVLDSARVSSASGWLGCRTDRGRLAVARWDFAGSDHDGWRVLSEPASGIVGLAVLAFASGSSLVVATGRGALLATDLNQAYRGRPDWRPVDSPAGDRALHAFAADAAGELGWAALGATETITLIELQRDEDTLQAGQHADLD